MSTFRRDCIIIARGDAEDKNIYHLMPYKASGKKFINLLDMEY